MSQNAEILRDLRKGKSITPLQALRDYQCLRLSGRIYDLKKRGIPVLKETVHDRKNGKRYAKYRLAKA